MKVYYDSSLWTKDGGVSGLPRRINWQFEYLGMKRFIPIIYHFPKGIVFDIITILDEKELHAFIEKYEAIEEKLTSLQRRCAEQEHPYQTVSIKEIWLNGNKVEGGHSSSSMISISWLEEKDWLTDIRKAYSFILKNNDCFGCQRFCVPYPETDSKIMKLLRFLRLNRVNRLRLLTHPMHWFFPLNIHFQISAEEKEKEISFKHPVTGMIHKLYFQKGEMVELPIGSDSNQNIYTMQSIYEIEPPLSEGDTLQFNSSMQYTTKPEDIDDKFNPISASAIGIIGRADGPTAVFIPYKGVCFSVPSFQKENTSYFVLEGINTKKYDSKEYDFY